MVAEPGITVPLVGGLGNQLFAYGTGLAAALRLNCPLYLDLSWFQRQGLREFELGAFAHSGLVRTSTRVQSGRAGGLFRRVRRQQFRERSFTYDPAILEVRPGAWLHGYFQSWRYLVPVATQLRAELSAPTDPSDWFVETAERLGGLGAWTAVHVRRGDYRNPDTRRMHGLVGADYYMRALEIDECLVGPRPVVVFSDEPHEARATLGSLDRETIFVEAPMGSPALESLLLISMADSAVLANSSYSWWGAWLTDHADKVVVAPRPWFGELSHDERDLLPPHWISVGH